ncbi:unnamed protein product [Blepharisma stoltei]|uniref:NADH dehydrogenase [ubiquinone] 1 alpha subcomplex subunit 12 n=1 Tax=Blepharisma stoltei TaxID=1481888 RepID=A0AAU9IYE7_9CILI|nr:unnamed protein product [Blepharisma stoltei]
MVGWSLSTILTGKFMKIWRMEGFIRTLERGRAVRFKSIEDVAGARDVAKCVGQDPYGNRYYQDFNADDFNESHNGERWVEFVDRHDMWQKGDRIPPEWHAWLHKMVDEPPTAESTHFYTPFFKKKHRTCPSGTPAEVVPHGHWNNPHAKQFQKHVKSVLCTTWEPEHREKRYD